MAPTQLNASYVLRVNAVAVRSDSLSDCGVVINDLCTRWAGGFSPLVPVDLSAAELNDRWSKLLLGSNIVEELRPARGVAQHRLHTVPESGIQIGQSGWQLAVEVDPPEAVAGRAEEELCKRITDQRIGAVGLSGPPTSDPQGRGADALVDVSRVVVSPGHRGIPSRMS
jgi:hypothetical protein